MPYGVDPEVWNELTPGGKKTVKLLAVLRKERMSRLRGGAKSEA